MYMVFEKTLFGRRKWKINCINSTHQNLITNMYIFLDNVVLHGHHAFVKAPSHLLFRHLFTQDRQTWLAVFPF